MNGLRIFGPSGDRPETGTQYMVDKMHEMMTWHLENFDHCPIGEGYNTEVVEFDYTDDNGICLQEEGLTVRHWGRSHVKNGCVGLPRRLGGGRISPSSGPATDGPTRPRSSSPGVSTSSSRRVRPTCRSS